MKLNILIIFLILSAIGKGQSVIKIDLLPGEQVWSGIIKDGHKMPYPSGYRYDFYANNQENQLQPLLMGNKGLWVWSEDPYAFEVKDSQVIISNAKGEVKYGRSGSTLAEARRYASANFFPASGKMPDELLFSQPQYNTWIELTYNQNQADVIKYARAIKENGYPAGVIMIDDTWQEDYGKWNFHPGRFPNPRQMVDELHQMGFKVMLWMCPFVSGDQAMIVQKIMKFKGFLMQQKPDKPTWDKATDPAMINWWNGYSALLDFTNPQSVEWFNQQLDGLVKEYGIDGFKLDAGDMNFYPADALSMKPATPNLQCELYAQFGLRFPLNEYRACWKMAGQPLAQRLHDKNHTWEDAQKLIPHMTTEALAGYTFSCPDMIGGGNWTSFLDLSTMDQDLVVRSAQIHALMPMMQFSVAPWRILDVQHQEAIKKAVSIRQKYTPEILNLANQSAKTGEPVICSMEYYFPGQGFEKVMDQFMLGNKILVAPVTKKADSRDVVLPKGKWTDDMGKTYKGGRSYTIDVPIDRIPVYTLNN
ncbi:MAG TPA: glycoside hydrolase family 31 protein [Prolixibacteraceae bacterium]|nr:glycoside hydrolase family 31 protein [Prolixibacteraceae bacterium]